MHILVALLLPLAVFLLLLPVLAAASHVSTHRGRLLSQRDARKRRQPTLLHAAVVSVTPASHSPRALNHLTSLADTGAFSATLHAHAPCPSILSPALSFIPIAAPAPRRSRSPFALLSAALSHAGTLYTSLVTTPDPSLARYDVILLNSPPCIPAFLVVLLAARVFHGCPVVVDWHNLGYSLMRTTGAGRVPVAVARALEWSVGRQMEGHLCVSRALATFLREEWAIDAGVLYDRPRNGFGPLDGANERHELFTELHRCAGVPMDGDRTFATERSGGRDAVARDDRPAVVVSSTSWTPDEDFGMLLSALQSLDARVAAAPHPAALPFRGRLLVAITGKGPLRAAFEARYAAAELRFVTVWFAWLPHADYPRLLGAADLGMCLHTSSSGLDLPMKVADMLGCGLPVAAFRFACVAELVRAGETGALFDDAHGLAERLWDAVFAAQAERTRARLRMSVLKAFATPEMRWHATWTQDALPLIERLARGLRKQA